MKRSFLAISVSLILMLGCQPVNSPDNPDSPDSPGASPTPAISTNPSSNPSSNPVSVGNQPPAIPEFPSQGSIPEGRPGGARGGFDDALGGVPMSAGAPMMDSAEGDYASGADEVSAAPTSSARSSESSKTTRPISPIMPPYEPEFPEDQVQPEAGLLTAGQWDDHGHWDFWLNLAKNQEWLTYLNYWGMNTQSRVAVTLKGPSGPLGDAPVQLVNLADQRVVFEARTNNQGQAYVFKDWVQRSFALQQNQQTQNPQDPATGYVIRVTLGDEILSHNLEASESSVTLTASKALEPAINADLMLVVDTTGSMGDELEYLKQELKNVARRIADQNRQDLQLRFSTNFYRDTTDDYVVRSFPFSSDINTVESQLSEQSAGGGGDFPEAVDYALMDAIDEHQWSPTAKARLLFLVLDAPAHQSDSVLQRLRTSVERAAAKGVRIIPVASSGINKETEFLLRSMSISTGGRYVFLTDDSGIGGGHIEPTVGDYDVEKLNDLMVKVATEYIGEAETSLDDSTQNPQQ